MKLLFKLADRHARRRPWQSFFFVIGVAIGVAMIVAIDLANASAGRAFELGTESVAGKATHEIVGGPTGLEQSVYTDLRREAGYRLSAPVVVDYVSAPELDGQPVRLLGIDPFAEAPFRSYLGNGDAGSTFSEGFLAALLTQPNTVLMSSDVAARYGLSVGDSTPIVIGGRTEAVTIVGLLAPSDELSRRALDGLLIADISTAQELLGRVGRIDRIDLIVPGGDAGEAALTRIQAILPPGARLAAAGARAGTVEEMTAAFRLNLTALSLLALVVGMFLIYNTVTFSVVQRRPVLGSLRALGMTRREIFGTILLEAGLLGLVGTVLGLGLGVVLGQGAVRAVTQTVNDLFFVVAVRENSVPIFTLVKGGVIGLVAAVGAAMIPAWEATNVPPAGALQRSNMEERVRQLIPWLSGAGVVLILIGAGLLIPEWSLVLTFAGLFGIVIGIALLTPFFILIMMSGLQRFAEGRLGVLARMAPRDVVRSLSRTSVAVAALMVAVSVIIGVGVMVGSFRLTVTNWLGEILRADIFISPPALVASRVTAPLPPGLVAEMAGFPGISEVATSREVEIVTDDYGSIRLTALSNDLAKEKRRYINSVGDWQVTWQALRDGGVVINEPMGNKYKLQTGDTLTLFTDRGVQPFTIVGVMLGFDASSVVFIDDGVYRSFWDDTGLSGVALYVGPGVDVDAKVNELRAAYADSASQIVVRSNRGLRENALLVFDRTFAITIALQLLATIVAFIGILSTLMSLQLEKRRELGVLRSTGMTRRQLWQLTLMETGLIGGSAGIIAMPTGFVLAIILIYIINLRSFGWTLQMQLQPGEFVRAFAVALIAALLAGIYPAWRMGQTQPADALRLE